MASFVFPFDQVILFLLVLVRVAAILFVIPFFDSRNVPVLVKLGLAMAVTLLLLPQLTLTPPDPFGNSLRLVLGITTEIAVGLIIGLIVQLIFAGIQIAGQAAGFQMGLALANVVDPASSAQIPMLSQFLNVFALLTFLSLNVHYYFVMALVDSFTIIPLWGAQFEQDAFRYIIDVVSNAFVIAIKIGAPVIVALMLASVALGLVARTVPQMQIFIVAMPLKIVLGFLFLGISLPFVVNFLKSTFAALGVMLQEILRIMA